MDQASEKSKFDFQVTFRDDKTGVVTYSDPYILRVVAAGDGGKMRVMERPKGSGNLFNKNNEPVGRWIAGKWDKDAAHVAFTPPETSDQKLARELIQTNSELAETKRELAAIKAEAEAKSAKAPAKKEQGA
jgi:hypothetical protein